MYGMKKSERAMLYWMPLMPRSSTMPSIFALPMLARSMWAY